MFHYLNFKDHSQKKKFQGPKWKKPYIWGTKNAIYTQKKKKKTKFSMNIFSDSDISLQQWMMIIPTPFDACQAELVRLLQEWLLPLQVVTTARMYVVSAWLEFFFFAVVSVLCTVCNGWWNRRLCIISTLISFLKIGCLGRSCSPWSFREWQCGNRTGGNQWR